MHANHRLQRICVWAGPAFLVTYLIAFWVLARFIPPPSPHWSAQHVAAFFSAHRFGIKLGMVLGLASSTLLFPFFTVVGIQMARIERGAPLLAIMWFGASVLLLVFFAVCGMVWCTAAFRADTSIATLRTLNDLGWLAFVMVFPAYTLQMLCLATAGLIDRSPTPTWPRPVAYFNLWVAVSGGGGGIAVFFTHGPFAWNGLIGFYIPLSVFAVWTLVTAKVLLDAINRQAAAETATPLPAETLGAKADAVGVGIV